MKLLLLRSFAGNWKSVFSVVVMVRELLILLKIVGYQRICLEHTEWRRSRLTLDV